MTNKPDGTLNIGVTNNLERRYGQHRMGQGSKFTAKYKLKKLVYFKETTDSMIAINREKQLKNWRRQWKIDLIESINAEWDDLGQQAQILNQVQDDNTSNGYDGAV